MAKVLLTQEEQVELEYLPGNFDWEAIFQAGTLVEELSSSEALVLSPSLSLPCMEIRTLLSMALLSGDLQYSKLLIAETSVRPSWPHPSSSIPEMRIVFVAYPQSPSLK